MRKNEIEVLDENQTEIDEPMTTDELLLRLTQDLILDNDPNDLASDFINEFVLPDRPESTQVLGMLDLPTEYLIEMMRGLLEQSYQTQLQAVDNHGIRYFENLKAAVKTQMTELTEQ